MSGRLVVDEESGLWGDGSVDVRRHYSPWESINQIYALAYPRTQEHLHLYILGSLIFEHFQGLFNEFWVIINHCLLFQWLEVLGEALTNILSPSLEGGLV